MMAPYQERAGMNGATATMVIESVWAFLVLLLATFLVAIVRVPPELASAASPPKHYIGRHARGRKPALPAGPPRGPAASPPGLPD